MATEKSVSHPICIRVARLLREERERQKLSKYAVAKRSGLSQNMVAHVENGTRNPTLETVLRMAKALELDFIDIAKRASKGLLKSQK